MPVVSVFEDCLVAALKGVFEINEDSFADLCFDFGLELDEVTSEFEMASKERGEKKADEAALASLSKRVIFKVDVPANRYDLLCLEGLVRGLKVYKGVIPPPLYTLSSPKPLAEMTMTVHAATAQIRPYVVCAILRSVTFDKDRYDSFIELQDKLHQNICRKRSLVAIGTHDLSTLKPPFTYEALPPKDIWFRPLNQTEEMDGNKMMEVLSQHQQLKAYLPLIRDSPVYPVIYDSNRVVLSLPPIINGEHSKIRLETKDVFIECTATDLTKANITLNTVVAMFAEYCSTPFVAEPVQVVYADDYPANTFTKGGDRIVYPKLEPREMVANIDIAPTILDLAGIPIPPIMDGQSMKPILTGKKHGQSWRTHFMSEFAEGARQTWKFHGTLMPLYDEPQNQWRMLRVINATHNLAFIEWDQQYVFDKVDFHEYYDISKDPWQKVNRWNSTSKAEQESLHAELQALYTCRGTRTEVSKCRSISSFEVSFV